MFFLYFHVSVPRSVASYVKSCLDGGDKGGRTHVEHVQLRRHWGSNHKTLSPCFCFAALILDGIVLWRFVFGFVLSRWR